MSQHDRVGILFQPTLPCPLFTVILLVLALIGCAKPIPVEVDLMKPAEVHLASVRKIAIADFQGQGGASVSNQVISKLVAGRQYEVLERARLARLSEELRLSQSDLVDPTTAAKLGRAAGVGALMFGEVDMYRVSDERTVTPLEKTRVVGHRNECDKKGKCRQVEVTQPYTVNVPTTIRRGHVSVSFRVVDVETGQILAAKTSSRKWEGVNIADPYPPRESITLPPPSAILEQLADKVAAEVVGVISPHRVRVTTTWLPVSGAEPALKYLNAGLTKEAQDHLEGMLKRSPTHPAEFYYDLGIVYALNGRLDDAEEMYKRAIALEPSNELFFKAIQAARQGKEDQKKLREQLGKRP